MRYIRMKLSITYLFILVSVLFYQSSLALAKSPNATRSYFYPIPVQGSNENLFLLYEIYFQFQNDKDKQDFQLTEVEVLDAEDGKSIATFTDETLKPFLKFTKPYNTPERPNEWVLFMYVPLHSKSEATPRKIYHQLTFNAHTNITDKIKIKTPALTINKDKLDIISSPLHGGGWFAANGPGIENPHRNTIIQNDVSTIPQRYAIDWIQIDGYGSLTRKGSSPAKLESYYSYGANVYSATSGKVISIIDKHVDNTPVGTTPQHMKKMHNLCGNGITVDMENGHFAFYCHLKPGSIKVEEGDRVEQGQLIANVGNSGNSTAPHLHFHLGLNSFVLGGDGIPYLINQLGIQLTPEEIGKLESEKQHTEKEIFDPSDQGQLKNNKIPLENGVYYFDSQWK